MTSGFAAVSAALAAAFLVAGCASTPPAPSAASAAPAVPAVGAAQAKAAPATRKKSGGGGYRLVTRDGVEVYCKRELVTGSRTNTSETCLTAQQMEAQRAGTEDFLRRVQDMSNTPPGGNPQGDYNNVMTSSGRIN